MSLAALPVSAKSVPFSLAGGALINQRGPLQSAIDTGTSTTAVAPELARELNLRDGSLSQVTTGGRPIRTSAAWLDPLRIGAAEVRDLDVVIGDFLEMLSDAIGVKLDGIVGYNFLRHYKVAIDYPNEKLSLFAA